MIGLLVVPKTHHKHEYSLKTNRLPFVGLGSLWILLLAGCNEFFYYPSPLQFSSPKALGLSYESVTFSSSDGTELTGWFIPALGAPEAVLGTVIQFHGNAENMSSHWLSLSWLPFNHYHLFTFDYRGYGRSKGSPDLDGPIQDSMAALHYIQQRKEVNPQEVIVIGQSLGGALAIAAVALGKPEGIRAIVLESTFSSYKRIAQEKLSGIWELA